MPSPDPTGTAGAAESVPELILSAARDVRRVATAFDAELLVSILVGAGYALAPPDRDAHQRRFDAQLREHLAAVATPDAATVSAVLDAWRSGPVPAVAGGTDPPWLPHLARVRATGGYAYGDRYGDQTTYIATFGYEDADLGGTDHAVIVVTDHNLGLATDLIITGHAAGVLDGMRADATSGELTWFAETGLAQVRAAATAYLRLTDLASALPDSDSLAANRALALARLALLPEPPAGDGGTGDSTGEAVTGAATGGDATGEAATGDVGEEFLRSPEAQLAGIADAAPSGASGESIRYCVRLITDFAAETRAGDPLRWSPTMVRMFLLEAVHTRAVLDTRDAGTLPRVLAAWVVWAGRRLGMPETAVGRTASAVRELRTEFARLCATGERQSPAVRATAALIADGVDLGDGDAVSAWLAAHDQPGG